MWKLKEKKEEQLFYGEGFNTIINISYFICIRQSNFVYFEGLRIDFIILILIIIIEGMRAIGKNRAGKGFFFGFGV